MQTIIQQIITDLKEEIIKVLNQKIKNDKSSRKNR